MRKTNKLNTGNNPYTKTDLESLPPGGKKIIDGLYSLLKDKDFEEITTADISKKSGVNEALIYRYFGNKTGLLFATLERENIIWFKDLNRKLMGIKGAENKLRKLIWESIFEYKENPVLAKIIFLEVRCRSAYFVSESYQSTRAYTKILRDIIDQGIEDGEITDKIPAWSIMQVILGAIEHMVIPSIIFDRNMPCEDLTEDLCNILFTGIFVKKPDKN